LSRRTKLNKKNHNPYNNVYGKNFTSMIVINSPKVEKKESVAILSSRLEIDNSFEDLWFEVPLAFQKYLVTENVDAFLAGILFRALKEGQDIQLKAPVSAKLFYNLQHNLVPALCLANSKFKPIKIWPHSLNEKDLNEAATAGTGLSCGVDSFAAYYDHRNDQNSYKIDYFAFFNAGSHGSGGENTTRLFEERYNKSKKFADFINKEIIKIDSNLSEILNMKFQATITLRNAACILILQKLFKNYYIASSCRFDYFMLQDHSIQYYDSLILKFLGTESTHMHSAVAQYTRVERTDFIAQFPETYKFLDVCTNSNKYKDGVNCSQCNKCLRTALTLDLLGKLHHYKEVFHIDKYLQLKNNYIGHIVKTRKKEHINKEVYDLLKEKDAIKYWKIVSSKIRVAVKGRLE